MGMGKTLSILALTMKTLDDGQQWADLKNQGHTGRGSPRYSGSTLIVVASHCTFVEGIPVVRAG